MTESICQEADRTINGARQGTYGPPEESLGSIAVLWSGYLEREISSHDVANLMVLLKVARSKRGFHRDSYVDIAGYAALTEKLPVQPVAPKPPRQWNALLDIPEGVAEVVTPSGVVWRYLPNNVALRGFGRWRWSGDGSSKDYNKGPFTETAIETKAADPTIIRRQWERFSEVPDGVAVKGRGGHQWKYVAGKRYLKVRSFDTWDSGIRIAKPNSGIELYGPFVEVLATDG